MSEWTPWSGGPCPVADPTQVEVMLRNGRAVVNAKGLDWLHSPRRNNPYDIISYRILNDDHLR